MKIYDIDDGFCFSRQHSVVAYDLAGAEKAYLKHYPGAKIKSIHLHSEYVDIADDVIKQEFNK